MPNKLFFDLKKDKRNKITNVALKEFAQHDYNTASTNSIVKKAGIGKGSLFKYFKNKEDLYFYILDYVVSDLTQNLKHKFSKLKGDIFEITVLYAELEFNWYMTNINKYKLLKRAFADNNSKIYKKTEKRYQLGDSFYYKIFEGANIEKLRWGKQKSLDILKWTLEGFNEDFIKNIDQNSNVNDIKACYLSELNKLINILKKGLCK